MTYLNGATGSGRLPIIEKLAQLVLPSILVNLIPFLLPALYLDLALSLLPANVYDLALNVLPVWLRDLASLFASDMRHGSRWVIASGIVLESRRCCAPGP